MFWVFWFLVGWRVTAAFGLAGHPLPTSPIKGGGAYRVCVDIHFTRTVPSPPPLMGEAGGGGAKHAEPLKAPNNLRDQCLGILTRPYGDLAVEEEDS